MSDDKRAGHSRKMVERSALSNTYSDISKSVGKRRKNYVDHLKDRSKHTCLIHIPVHSSDECMILGDYGSKYSKRRPTKDCRYDPSTINKFNRK